MNDYWIERQAKAQNALTDKGIAATEKQLKKYSALLERIKRLQSLRECLR